ncbi:potassium-transporting ATPase subunit C [Corynebacterium kroppenstedtii]|uniref:potassium-transporting ATPase subunit C n=1 Tax=Corynebacterium sp. PCR 32 TaxID=3351342 RepID=UPI0030952511
MMSLFPSRVRHAVRAGGVSLGVFTVIVGLVYPLCMVGIGAVALPHQAGGSVMSDSAGHHRGSSLLAQQPREGDDSWFFPRPSAGEGQASNASPDDPAFRTEVEKRRREVAMRESLSPGKVPAEALAASGSGVDPHISREYAEVQVPRVSRHTGISEARLHDLVVHSQQSGDLVNVTTLNAAVAQDIGSH